MRRPAASAAAWSAPSSPTVVGGGSGARAAAGATGGADPVTVARPLVAAAGIICLGLVPTLGGPEQPLHWAVTAGMAGFGVLLWARRRLRGAEAPLPQISKQAARTAGRIVLAVVGVIAVLVGVIIGFRV